MGKALIATDVAGCRSVVEHGVNGLLVPVKNVAALSDAMISMIKDSGFVARAGIAARTTAVRDFDEQIVVKRVLRAYATGVA